MNITSTAASGLVSAMNRFDQASLNVVQATAPGSTADPAAAITDQISAKAAVQASAAVLKSTDEMYKSTLDILA